MSRSFYLNPLYPDVYIRPLPRVMSGCVDGDWRVVLINIIRIPKLTNDNNISMVQYKQKAIMLYSGQRFSVLPYLTNIASFE